MPVAVGTFLRRDLASVERGIAVEYFTHEMPFSILACRTGVACQGQLPFMNATGVKTLTRILNRAVRQHEKLKVPIGSKQEPLTEEELTKQEDQWPLVLMK